MDLFVAGTPQPQPRPRARVMGKHATVYSPKLAWRRTVARRLAEQGDGPQWSSPLTCSLRFVLPRPKSHYRSGRNAHLLKNSAPKHPLASRSGDVDNLAKAVLDEMNGWAYVDDAQVVELHITKTYVRDMEVPGCWIMLSELSDG